MSLRIASEPHHLSQSPASMLIAFKLCRFCQEAVIIGSRPRNTVFRLFLRSMLFATSGILAVICCNHVIFWGSRGNRVIRIRFSSTTEKCPAQSEREARAFTATRATDAGALSEILKRTTPLVAGRPERKANSPKSLSKVNRIRFSDSARDKTCSSGLLSAPTRRHGPRLATPPLLGGENSR